MSQDSFTEVTRESFLERIGGAIKGVLIGGALFIVAFPFLFWNEGRAVKTSKTLSEGATSVIAANAETINPANSGKLIHLSGQAATEETLKDPIFGVSAKAIRLKRVAEMYQWKEQSERKSERKMGGESVTTTTYIYDKGWAPALVDSSKFKQREGHENPAEMPWQTEDWEAKAVHVGALQLGSALLRQINQFTPMSVDTNKLEAALPAQFRLESGHLYRGQATNSPQIGDVRVSFQKVEPAEVSIVARQNGSTLEPHVTKAGGSIALLRTGVHSADAMFQAAQQGNTRTTWIFRLAGFVVMFLGLGMVLRPLSVLADVLPAFGSIVAAGTTVIAGLFSAALTFVTIAVAWISYRPLLGIGILLVAGVFGFIVKVHLARQKAVPAPTAEEPLRRAA